jgi:hypothetical protein
MLVIHSIFFIYEPIWPLANGFDPCYNYTSIMRFGPTAMFENAGALM